MEQYVHLGEHFSRCGRMLSGVQTGASYQLLLIFSLHFVRQYLHFPGEETAAGKS